ncbi:MAG: TolC family protein [Planctomycetota bacterium]
MKLGRQLVLLFAFAAAASLAGCSLVREDRCFESCPPCEDPKRPARDPAYLEIDEPCPDGCLTQASASSLAPDAVPIGPETRYWELSLEDAIHLTLQRSDVLRDLGATVLLAPEAARTSFEPAITQTDPRFGEEAALADFDATLDASGLWENNDRVLNNTFLGDNGVVVQDLGSYNVELRKQSATGAQMAIRHVTDYDFNNFVGNRFSSPSGSWTTFFDLEVRQPLWQGAGSEFNRIAGPNGAPGALSGVVLARVRSDISLAEFEAGVRNLVSNVENAYWDLYFAYYDLEAKKSARDQSLALLNSERGLAEGGAESAENALQAEEQYWRVESDVQDSLFGRLVDGTRTNNGAAGGSFRSVGGVRVAERRLRLIIGLPITTGELIKPVSEPVAAPIAYDWNGCTQEALAYRAELRRQRWQIKQRELELIANKNFLKPRLDVIARYRQRGFGNALASQSDGDFSSAFGNLGEGDNEEWQLGLELEVPIGFRRAHSAVRNAELAVAREVALLREQEQQVLFGLSNAVADVERAYRVLTVQYNRLAAVDEQVRVLTQRFQDVRTSIDIVLDAQRLQADAQTRFRQAQVEYMLALKNVHYEKGTLLEHNGVYLAESGAPRGAYGDVMDRRRSRRFTIDYVKRDRPVSRGRAPSGMINQTSAKLLTGVSLQQPAPPAADDAAPAPMLIAQPEAFQPGALQPEAPIVSPLGQAALTVEQVPAEQPVADERLPGERSTAEATAPQPPVLDQPAAVTQPAVYDEPAAPQPLALPAAG